ncbi:uncharacterized protein LOC112577155 isoform X1 [Pomacea canaliculata]|uniref:uncharacterized protein LOC112577155 isoform X1 n=1 Tax=Pomacea canaliculata TaxID=400727 RepID=UPI000D73772A|nr:uncharacterized protein LOC112577155 isoform X1 [Pomacea canaliculata]
MIQTLPAISMASGCVESRGDGCQVYRHTPASPTQVGEQNSTGQLSVLWTSQPCAPNKETCVQESTLRDDFAQQHVLHCLQALAEHHGEVMFVISQLRFSDYLNRPCYSATTALFPRFSDIEKRFRDGDFDVLVLHRRYGVVIGEIKSVGLHAGTAENSYQNLVDDVAKRVRKAAWQLNKSSEVLRYLLHDLSPPPPVHKALILPYITSNSLGAVLEKYEDLKTTLCQCLETETTDDAVQLCLCSNQMSDRTRPWEFTDDVMSGLSHWWLRLTTHEDDYSMTGDIYEDIVARFCGPATTIRVHCSSSPLMEVRNRGDGVSEVGNRLRKLVLTPQQIDLLVTAPSRVFLSGPCGTGKTVVLVLMALQWLYQGHDVHIVSSWVLGLAASYLVHHQLEGTMQAYQNRSQPTGKVHIHFYNFQKGEEEVTKSINDLVNFAKNETLHIVMDEVYPDPTNNGSEVAILAKSYNQFVMELTAKNREVHLWMAGAMHNCIPYGLEEKQMLVPLRCVPVVQRMLINVVDLEKINIKNYANRIHHSCDGPNIIQLMHAGDGHAERWPLECWQCGFQIAEVLLQHLQIGCGIPGMCERDKENVSVQRKNVSVRLNCSACLET